MISPCPTEGGARVGFFVRIIGVQNPWYWYAQRIGERIHVEFEDGEGYWAREGGAYDCINVIRHKDAERCD